MVNKMHTLNPNVLKNQIRQIEPYCVTNRLEIDSWKSYTGMHVSPNNIVLDENPPIQMYLGDRWNHLFQLFYKFQGFVLSLQ